MPLRNIQDLTPGKKGEPRDTRLTSTHWTGTRPAIDFGRANPLVHPGSRCRERALRTSRPALRTTWNQCTTSKSFGYECKPFAGWGNCACIGLVLQRQAHPQVELAPVRVRAERLAAVGAVVLQLRVVEVERVEGEGQVVVELPAGRGREVALVVHVLDGGVVQACQEGRPVGVGQARVERAVVVERDEVVGVLRVAHHLAAVGDLAVGIGVVHLPADDAEGLRQPSSMPRRWRPRWSSTDERRWR